MIRMIIINILCFLILTSCSKGDNTGPLVKNVTISITTDKAVYNPSDVVNFKIDKALPATARVRYRYLNQTLEETSLNGQSWSWTAPSTDYKGYMVDVFDITDNEEYIYGSIAVDVSSDWSKFPRYGFLSKFPELTDTRMSNIVDSLSRCHINGIMFYDFENKHHKPLAGTTANPENSWYDIAKRTNYLTTVQGYITKAHERNMMAMFYNLAYGAWKNAAADGVSSEWYMYTNTSHSTIDYIYLDNNWSSSIYLLDPSNTGWQDYIARQNDDLYSVFDFDGFHVDQVGNRDKNLYTYNGTLIDLPGTFAPFLNAMKTKNPGKRLVMNAVDQLGQEGIATTNVDFMYSEVWTPTTYDELAKVITDNNTFCGNTKNTVLAAYMNRGLSGQKGFFNLPGVLLTESVIFAFGGSHIELGEHMLVHEYFPNSNLTMSVELKRAMISYYDFLVAYENILRDGGAFNTVNITSADRQMNLNSWPPQTGNVAVLGKEVGKRQVIHLINFSTASDLNWRDNDGSRTVPVKYSNSRFDINVNSTVGKVWYASPDYIHGSSTELEFVRNGNTISLSIPYMQYWGMIVIEYL
ncbi:MAG TPA: glycoside hydrolase family 66 protein [Bacteroidales bacterium]|nr:glycoside hydrolase family 66 protein [Bacteroidales bacterium]